VSTDQVSDCDESDDRDESDVDAEFLDDERDRAELRTRYYALLQENRVLLPGVQILVAFFVTIPFNRRFEELDGVGQTLWAVALSLGCVAIVCLMTPIVFHRVASRRRRSVRLVWSIRTQRVGIVSLAGSLVTSVVVVTRFVGGLPMMVIVVAVLLSTMGFLWLIVPLGNKSR
jgi:hypothetical protein